MATAKNIFENVAETQKKVMDSILESSKSFTDFSKSKAYESAPDFYKNWVNNQMNFMKNFVANQDSTTKNGTHTSKNEDFAEFYKELYSNQMNFFKNAFENIQNGNKSNDFMKSMGMNPAFMNNQWMNNNPFANFTSHNKFTEGATNIYNSFASNFNKNVEMLSSMFTNNITKDSFKNLNNNMEAYTNLYQIWLPIFKSIQTKMYDAETLKNMANPAQFKNVMDKVFNFNALEQIQGFTNLLNNSANYSQEQTQAKLNEMYELNNKNMALLPKIMAGDVNAIQQYNQNIIDYSKSIQNPLEKFFPQWSENEITTKMQSLSTDLNNYSAKIAKMQNQMYATGQKSLEKLIKETAKLAEQGKDISNFNEFYQKWIALTEKSYTEFFKTNEFSELQGEVINMGLRLKQEIDAQSEKMFEGLPIAKKSELDELYKAIADLKRRLRAVEKPTTKTEPKAKTVAPKVAKAKTVAPKKVEEKK